MSIEDSELFTEKMMELYGSYEDTLNGIIKNRKQYEDTDDPAYNPYKEAIKIYDLYKKIDGQDKEISEALHATALWYVYKNISGDDDDPSQFMDEPEDDKKGKPKLNYERIADFLIKRYSTVSYKGEMYIYIDNQYYNGIGARERIEKDILKILKGVGYSDHTKVKDLVNEIVYKIRISTTKFKEFPFNKRAKDYIPVQNGVIVRKNLNLLLPPSPSWGFVYSLPVIFDKEASTDNIENFLHSLVATDDEYEILLQIPAQGLLQDEGYETSYLLIGDGKNGKSTYINLNRNFIGRGNYTTISLQDLIENRFAKAELDGKLMNMFSDLPASALKHTGIFKALSGSDEITGERKFGQPFQFVNKAVLIFSANEAPIVTDSSFAFWRRWEIVNMPYKFELDPTFSTKLFTKENLSGYLNLIIKKMMDIEKNGITRTKSVEESMNSWMKSSDNTLAFIEDMLIKSPKDYVIRDSLYKIYTSYCDEKFLIPLTANKLFKNLEKMGCQIGRAVIAGKRPYIIKGVKLKKMIDAPDLIIDDVIKSDEDQNKKIFYENYAEV